MALSSGARLGPYEILAAVGAGGMGEVYKARDTRLDRTVAIKVLSPEVSADPERGARFEREAKIIAGLNHPHICALYDVGEHDGSTFLVMEFLDGQTLAQHLRRGALPLGEVLQYGVQIADALARAHRQGIIHRDLKPGNIMLTRSGAKLLDFGVAKLKAEGDRESAEATTTTRHETHDGHVVGTSGYMSPEQAQALPVDHRSDIFSLGIVLYEMCTGTRPFTGATRTAVLSSIVKDTPTPVQALNRDLPIELWRAIRRCLQKDPEERYQSAADLRSDLAELRAESTSGERMVSPAAQRPRRLGRWLVFASVMIGLIAVVTTLWLPRSGRMSSSGSGGVIPPPTPSSPAAIVPTRVTAAPGWETQPVLSADGLFLAYTSNESGNSDIWVAGVGGGNAVNVSNNPATDEKPTWFPDSSVAFASDRGGQWNVWKAPPLGGGASLLVANARDPAVSPDGREIAFVRPDETGNLRVTVAPLADPSRARMVTEAPDRLAEPEQDPSWSPDGKALCYSSYRSLWIASSSGGGARQLTRDRENDIEPAWSGDGRSVYFSSNRGGICALWRVAASGGPLERLTHGPGPERHPSVSKDGKRVAFSTFSENSQLVLRDLVTGEERLFGTTLDETSPAFSPDGRTLVYVRQVGARGGTELWRQPLADGGPAGSPQRLSNQPGSVSQPGFSPDGLWVVYQRVIGGSRDIWTIPTAGGEPVRFTDDPADDVHPVWSRDGTSIAFASLRGGAEHIWIAPVRNGRPAGPPRQLTREPGNQERPAWSPDGRRVAYLVPAAGGNEVWAVPTDGSGPTGPLTSGADAQWVRWDPRGAGLIVCGTWGEGALSLRIVNPETRAARPFNPPVRVGDPSSHPVFNVSRDGRLVTFARGVWSGDVWVLETGRQSP
jgi:eukaryotic-like serine/threonine-protein kinase